MSCLERNKGKLVFICDCQHWQDKSKEILKQRNIEISDSEDACYELREHFYNEFLFIDGYGLFRREILDNQTDQEGLFWCEADLKPDGSIYYDSLYYNGGTCLEECLKEEFDNQGFELTEFDKKSTLLNKLEEIIEKIEVDQLMDFFDKKGFRLNKKNLS